MFSCLTIVRTEVSHPRIFSSLLSFTIRLDLHKVERLLLAKSGCEVLSRRPIRNGQFGSCSQRSEDLPVIGDPTRSLRIGMMLGAIATCLVSLFRREAKVFWWGAGIVVCTMLLESVLGTLGTLMLGGSLIYMTAQPQVYHCVGPKTVQQAV